MDIPKDLAVITGYYGRPISRVGWFTLRDEQCHGDEGCIGDALGSIGPVQGAVLFQKPQKQRGANALVAVHKWVIFNQEVEQIGGLLFDAGIEIPSAEGLHDCPEGAFHAVVLLPSEEIGTAKFFSQAVHHAPGLVVAEGFDRPRRCGAHANTLMVVVVQEIEGKGIIGHDGKQGLGFAAGQFPSADHVGNEADRLIELAEAALVDAVPLEEMVPQDRGRPDAELGEALAGGCDLHRLHWHATPAQGQADDA